MRVWAVKWPNGTSFYRKREDAVKERGFRNSITPFDDNLWGGHSESGVFEVVNPPQEIVISLQKFESFFREGFFL